MQNIFSTSITTIAFFLVVAILLPISCGSYYIKQGTRLFSDQFKAKPIHRFLNDTTASDKQKRFFNEVVRIRSYGFDSIGFTKNNNYTRFVTVDSSYLVAVVCAADSASFTVKKWCYPFLGCFPLRGYYDSNDAEKTARQLSEKGYETHIDKVDGFSTLGIFSDPLYSFMTHYPVFFLAQFIFHEQTHATAYFKNVPFSEEAATFIGQKGALAYLACYYGTNSPEYKSALLLIRDQDTYLRLLRQLYTTLDTLYKSTAERPDKIARKHEAIHLFKSVITNKYDSLFATPWYKDASKRSFNNAFLALRMTYHLNLEMFEKLYIMKGSDLKEVVSYVKALKKRRGDPSVHLSNDTGIQPQETHLGK